MKQAIVARRDLEMTAGKLAAQVAHAAVQAADAVDTRTRNRWRGEGGTKVVLGVDGETALFEIADRAKRAGIPTAVIRDAGRTQLESGTATAVAVGPDEDDAVDAICGDLPLY